MKKSIFLLIFLISINIHALELPAELWLNETGNLIFSGKDNNTSLYDQSVILDVYLEFYDTGYWNKLTQNYASETEIPAKMTVNGIVYDSVGVRFRGQTSYQNTKNSEKKSFNISLDFVKEDQRLMGYKTLNLMNCFEDASFMREVFYQNQSKPFVPIAKSAFIRLHLNGILWGLYPNVQQLNKNFYSEWFYSNDGSNWRADVESTGGMPGGGGQGAQWGDGTAALNYLGDDTIKYQKYYTLKSSKITDSWARLAEMCKLLNNTNLAEIPNTLPAKLDIDRTLWFLAVENLFSDDDSYIHKGKMDYYIYFDEVSEKFTPIEYDGNSVMKSNAANWSPFMNETNINYPLMNKLFGITEYRQRYIAHYKTVLNTAFDTVSAFNIIDGYAQLIDNEVNLDPKKLYTYQAFKTEINVLKNFIRNRRKNILANSEFKMEAPVISETAYYSDNNIWVHPTEDSKIHINSNISHSSGINSVNLYYSKTLSGSFEKIQMIDDGNHDDGKAGDNKFGVELPPLKAGDNVRFYIEAVAGNSAKTVSYDPQGAEHDVYYLNVKPKTATAESSVVINEFMASNTQTINDESGKYEDWIEFYNNSDSDVDLSGYFISDNPEKKDKWVFPEGSVIGAKSYYILWADEDSEDGINHCNFKLSASEESLYFSNKDLELLDSVSWGEQTADMSFARKPNGTGSFMISSPTFNSNNDGGTEVEDFSSESFISVYPNPASEFINIQNQTNESLNIKIANSYGEIIQESKLSGNVQIDISGFVSGIYFIYSNKGTLKFSVVK